MTFEILSTPVNSAASLIFQQCLAEVDPENRSLNSAMNEVGGYFLDKAETSPLSNELWNNVLNDGADNKILRDEFIKNNNISFNQNDIKAFSILGINIGLRWEKVQEKFKKLVKKYHPDMNAGSKKYEDRLKVITLAYTQLKNTYRKKIDKRY